MRIRDLQIAGEVLPIVMQPAEGKNDPDLGVVGFGFEKNAQRVASVGCALLYSPGSVSYFQSDGRPVELIRRYAKSAYAIVTVEPLVRSTDELAPSWVNELIQNERGETQRAGERWPYAMPVLQAFRLKSVMHLDFLRSRVRGEWNPQSVFHFGHLDSFADVQIEPWQSADDPLLAQIWRLVRDRVPVVHKGYVDPSDSVYAITSGARPNLLKIGAGTGGCLERLVEARRWLPPDSTEIAWHAFSGIGLGGAAEAWLHKRFAKYRVGSSEWFSISILQVKNVFDLEYNVCTAGEILAVLDKKDAILPKQ